MKALLITIVIVGVSVWAILNFGGMFNFDPADQIAEFNQATATGATWQSVVADYKAPKLYKRKYINKDGDAGVTPEIKFDQASFESQLADGKMEEGFLFIYRFTAEDQYDVHFDGDGVLTHRTEPITMGDLIDGTATQKMMQ